MKKKIIAGAIILIMTVIAAVYLIQSPCYYEYREVLSDPETIKEYVLGFGILSPIILILIQALQVIIPPIPGMVTSLAAGALYGVIFGFLLNVFGVLLGSLVAFYLARKFGTPLVIKIVGKKVYNKYNYLVSEKYTIGLFILFFLPFFPDDALCLLAGISAMPFSLFLFLMIVGRAPGLFVSTLVGSGALTLSLPVWMLLGSLSLLVIILAIKYNRKIEHFIYRKVEEKAKRFRK